MGRSLKISVNARKSAASTDTRRPGPTDVTQQRGLPTVPGRRRLNKLARSHPSSRPTRIATFNVGSLTGRAAELADKLRRRKIDICTLQETRWVGAKSKNLGSGYKLLFNGSTGTKNGVGIAVSKRFRDAILEARRYDDRLMKVVFLLANRKLHLFTAYAPQTGCPDATKDTFWSLLDEQTRQVPPEDIIVIAGDLNGHVGHDKNAHPSHGGLGYGTLNDDGQRILNFAESHDLAICNTFFKKRESHLITYYSGHKKTQIDYVLVRQRDRQLVHDVKALPYVTIATQHRPIVAKIQIEPPPVPRPQRTGPARVKWHKFRVQESAVITRVTLPAVTTVEATWQAAKASIEAAASSILGKTKPGRRYHDKQAWLWTDDVKTKVRDKKQAYHAFLDDKTPANWSIYRNAKSAAKRAIATVKSAHFEDFYKKLDTKEGERELYRLVRSRHHASEDIEKFACVNDVNGQLLTDRRTATERWRQYFEAISTEEFAHPPVPSSQPVHGPVHPISPGEVEEALSKMKLGKATGPDDIAVDIWKSRGWNPVNWISEFFNRIVVEGRIPADWTRSSTVPIFKRKGSPAECSNYRPIRLLSHTMKVFERILDRRLRELVDISRNQCGFVKGCGTTDAIHAARLLLEKHREKNKPIHLVFIDLEKAFDRVPRDVIWYALRQHGVPEELVRWVKMLYSGSTSRVRAAAGTSEDFNVTVGVHQGSALSPLLFNLVMDVVTRDLQRSPPWTMLYADDVMLAADTKADLEKQAQAWNERLALYGMRLNKRKTEYLTTDPGEDGTIQIDGKDLPRVDAFRYLGSTLTSDGSLLVEVNARTNAAWMKWRTATGVLCDRKISDCIKGKIYRSIVRPVATYAAETWPATKEAERRLAVMETKMLRWIGGVTRFDHVPNDDTRNRYGVAPITDKMREARLRWYGHVLRAADETIAKIGLNVEVDGKRPKGRPKQRWLDTLHNDLKIAGLHPDHATNRAKWRDRSRKADPAPRDKR